MNQVNNPYALNENSSKPIIKKRRIPHNRPVCGDLLPGQNSSCDCFDESSRPSLASGSGVSSFNGRTGNVVLSESDIPDLSNTYQKTLKNKENLKSIGDLSQDISLLGQGKINIKTINNQSIFGSGNMIVESGLVPFKDIAVSAKLKGKTLCFNTSSRPVLHLNIAISNDSGVQIGEICSEQYNYDYKIMFRMQGSSDIEVYNNHDGWKYSYLALNDLSVPSSYISKIEYGGGQICPFIQILGTGIDIEVIRDSHNLVTSGAVYRAVVEKLVEQDTFVPKRLQHLKDAKEDKNNQYIYVDDGGHTSAKTTVAQLQNIIKTVGSTPSPKDGIPYVFVEIN